MNDVWSQIRIQQELSDQLELQAAEDTELVSCDEQDYDYSFEENEDADESEDDYESQLLSAQQQWEESLEQLSQVLNWVLLPLIGKYLGRRTALRVWRNVIEYIW
ncbi:LANO_0C06920g1_1 [Lachancea nothofagi CBS 11611]|uniref:LANO_0C06920g1_1 n=1 Tax=Lachancea nothofagi CBS 11611 TaxID=1266666 RepID=A0A1G4J8Z2_9SACH|nr:LANO_0C06920g1_1 [Lachancea nothofagi CBS 11611]